MNTPMTPVADYAVKPQALIYEHGWQSFSPSCAYRLHERPLRPTSERNRILNYRQSSAPGTDVFFGEGLLAVEDGDGVTHIVAGADPFTSAVRILARVCQARVVVSADGPVSTTSLALPLQDALAAWATRAALDAGLSNPRSAPTAWCSWYHYYGDVTPGDVIENAVAINSLELPVDVVQIDDGYSIAIGDWLTPSPEFRDIPGLIGRLKDSGHRAGIWIAPFLAAADSELALKHPEWLVRHYHGAPRHAGHNWNRDLFSVDLTHPDAAAWMRGVLATFRSWGIDYVKADFLAAGSIPGERYSGVDPVTAYRSGLALLRDELGPACHLLGCGAPVLPSVGLVDSLRVSADTSASVEPEDGDYSSPSQAAATLGGRGRQFMNGVFFVNDPDCLIVGDHVADRERWAAHVEATRGAVVVSDRLLTLDSWGLDTTRRLLTAAAQGLWASQSN